MSKRTVFGKSVPVFLIASLMLTGLGSAALVGYLSNTITATVDIDSPVTLVGDQFSLDVLYGGEDDFALIEITNNADVDISGAIEFAVSPDSNGVNIAISEDINYCFADMGDMTDVLDCKTGYVQWVTNNPDWMDWYANAEYNEDVYPSDIVINHGENSFHSLGGYIDNVLSLPIDSENPLPAETTLYGIVYVATNPALTPGIYDISVTMVPAV